MEHQIHYGKKFYKDQQTGYWISTTCPKIRAHVWVWENYTGKKVPKGFHVHHHDSNKSNNDITNLIMHKAINHLRLHMTEDRKQWARQLVEKIRPMTKAWHASQEGRKWHSDHGKMTFVRNKSQISQCMQCKMEYNVDILDKTRSKFCSNKCKSANRRKIGTDNIEIKCSVCEKNFTRNKYAKTKTCSRKCGGIFKSKINRGRGN